MDTKKVGLVYTDQYTKYNFGINHPLRPLRLSLTYSLMEKLGLLDNENLEIIKPRYATREEIELVHKPKYVSVVETLSKNPQDPTVKPFLYGLGPGDNPVFEGMYDASALVCGASISAAEKVWNDDDFNRTFNPAGGLHHAMIDKASGFCIFNDIAVAIRYLQKQNPDIRVAYLDIDCHHGDGVQWVFYDDPNVLTISLHESGKYLFPGTGNTDEIGEGAGEGYAINFPLIPGTSTKMYLRLFKECIPKILDTYRPDLLVTQLGVDTHFNDPLTQLGASIKLYKLLAKEIDKYTQKYCNNKWLAVGGGGYLMTVVPRAWSLFLAQMLNIELENELPQEWIQEAKKSVTNEDTPYLLWDRGDKIEVQLLAHPELAKKMNEYTNSLIELCNNQYIENLK
ncbi:MAG: acetoin utilization protein AcuC [Candidatus Lokiarchaeota archaeon]|nr:acetoin utilization protein AcuC [Candidatus Lokiarchaeota archaeon]MBD3200037.1 acetoin utilization protein AcuC [Candidatus Lokiarchaeota archaeon]